MRVALLMLMLMLAGACAHVEPASSAAQPAKKPLFVTGSRIPRAADPLRAELEAFGPVRVFSRERLVESGHSANLSEALHTLDPSF